MNGLQTFEGDDSERTEEVRQLTNENNSFAKAKHSYQNRPVALIHYSQKAIHLLHYFEADNGPSASLPQPDRRSLILRGAHRWLDTLGYQIRFVTDAEMTAGLPAAEMLIMPLSPVLDSSSQQATMRWVNDSPGRQLWLGPDTALLDQHGRWLDRKDRPLWSWLGVEPGPLIDLKDVLTVDRENYSRFRILKITGSAEILLTGRWRENFIPAQLKCAAGVFLHAYDWTTSFGAEAGSQAIPT